MSSLKKYLLIFGIVFVVISGTSFCAFFFGVTPESPRIPSYKLAPSAQIIAAAKNNEIWSIDFFTIYADEYYMTATFRTDSLPDTSNVIGLRLFSRNEFDSLFNKSYKLLDSVRVTPFAVGNKNHFRKPPVGVLFSRIALSSLVLTLGLAAFFFGYRHTWHKIKRLRNRFR